jgi:hypothetical protein
MNKKNKLALLDQTLDKALSPPKKKDRSVLDSLLEKYGDEEVVLNLPSSQKTLDTQSIQTKTLKTTENEHSNKLFLDTPTDPSKIYGHSNNSNTDTLQRDFGHSTTQRQDTYAPKKEERTPKQEKVLSAYTPQNKILDTQESKNYRKYEAKRTTVRINLHVSKETDRKVREYCLKTDPRLELKEFFELAARHFLDTQSNQSLGVYTPYDDRRLMMNWKSRLFIINLYLQYNEIFNKKTKWTVNDDEKAFRFNEVNPKVIELGIIQTQFQKGFKGKINSFSYYINEIENFIELGMDGEVLETMLKINRQRWQKATGKELDYSEFEKNESV